MGRYELILPIASGGMATVYLARIRGADGFERKVALKLTHAHLRNEPEFHDTLIEEAKLVGRIAHPNVVAALDAGRDANGVYLVMDYVEGDTFSSLQKISARNGTVMPRRIGARILLDALAGLHAAHELRDSTGQALQLVHRDFTPQNLLVGVDGLTRLADFGVAKAVTQLTHTSTGLVKGKLSYMAPEQARAQPLDRRCDVWAAGVVAWEFFAQRRLFYVGNDAATLLRIMSGEIPSLHTESGVAVAISAAIDGALRSPLEERYATAAAFRETLLAACSAADGIADHDEVAAFARAVLHDKLASRSRQADEIVELRGKLAHLAADLRPVVESPSGPVPLSRQTMTDLALEPSNAMGVKTSRPRRVALLGGALLIGLAALVVAPRAWRDPSRVAVSTMRSRSIIAPAVASTSTLSMQPVQSAPPGQMVLLRANVPIAAASLDGLEFEGGRASREIRLYLPHASHQRTVLVRSLDGRRIEASLMAGATHLDVHFPTGRRPSVDHSAPQIDPEPP